MADRYIDHEETLIYGPYAARKIRSVVVGLLPKFDPALHYLIDELEAASQAMERSLKSARSTDSVSRASSRERKPALAQGLEVLKRFSRHLDGHKPGTVDKKRFFPSGTFSAIGTSSPRVLLALSQAASELLSKDAGVTDQKSWHKELAEAASELAPIVEHADSARTTRRGITAAMEQARFAWLQVYVSARCVVEAVLRLTGRLQLMSAIFFDLAVPGDAKVTAPPPEPPTTTDPAASPQAESPAAAVRPAPKRRKKSR